VMVAVMAVVVTSTNVRVATAVVAIRV